MKIKIECNRCGGEEHHYGTIAHAVFEGLLCKGCAGKGYNTAEATCENCHYWYAMPAGKGMCRRFPPKVIPGAIEGVRPETRSYNWCGEWEEKDE